MMVRLLLWVMLTSLSGFGCNDDKRSPSVETPESEPPSAPIPTLLPPINAPILGAPAAPEPGPCTDEVEITWLGVTTYALSYEYLGRKVRVLLDHQINGAYYHDVMATLGFDTVDYVVIGHSHFDHTGDCIEQGDLLCGGALVTSGSPALGWDGAPYESLAVGGYGAMALGPHRTCEDLDATRCRGLWSLDGVQEFELADVGLKVIAFPSAHSVIVPYLDDEREHPTDDEPDPYSFIFEFPAERSECRTSMLWASSTLSASPYLSYTETLEVDGTQHVFDYRSLLIEALRLHEGAITYWTFAAAGLPGRAEWSLWADHITPFAWSNHHHGQNSAEYFPDLHLPGPADLALSDTPWLSQQEPGGPRWLPLDDWWTTVVLRGGTATLRPDRRNALQSDFRARVGAR